MKYLAMAFMATTLALVGCGDDPVVPPVTAVNVAPTIEIQLPDGSTPDSIAYEDQGLLGAITSIVIVAADGNDNLSTISYQRDGVNLPLNSTDVRPDSASNFVRANPALVDSSGFTRTFFITSPIDYSTSTTYTFTVRDSDGEEATADIVFSQPEEVISTPLSRTLEGVLFNQAGPSGTGGLDLSMGTGTSSTSALAEIRDMGIDSAIPVGTENWIRRIAPVNMTQLRMPSSAWVAENPFADVDSKEAILEAFNSSSVDLATSDVVNIGDIFVVFDARDDNYYLINTKNIFVETETAAPRNNNDRYVFDIKY